MIGQWGRAARTSVAIMATLEMMSTLHAGENTKRPLAVGKTGGQLPVWVIGRGRRLRGMFRLASLPAQLHSNGGRHYLRQQVPGPRVRFIPSPV